MLAQLELANLLSFGNGPVMVALLQRAFVEDAHALTNDQLLYAFAIARVTPGQANLYVASIAYMMFGFGGALLSMVAIAAPSYLMIPLMGSYARFRRLHAVRRFTRGLASTAVGLMLASTWNISKGSLDAPVAWVVLAVALGLMLFTRLPTLVSLALGTGLGIAVVLLVPRAA